MSMKQSEAVFAAVQSVMSEHGIAYHESQPTVLNRDLRAEVNNILFAGFKAGKIVLSKQFTDQELKSYCSGLLSNWLRKDKRLNGNTTYVAKNPGSRVTDPSIKAMTALLQSGKVTNDTDRAEIETLIATRKAELAASKSKVEVDFDALPESIRAKFEE